MAWSDAARAAAAEMRKRKAKGASWRLRARSGMAKQITNPPTAIKNALRYSKERGKPYVVYRMHDSVPTFAIASSKEYKPKQVIMRIKP